MPSASLPPWLLLALSPVISSAARAQPGSGDGADAFAHPPELERDVRFWIRVYTEVTTDQGLLHDDWNLGLVYEVLRFDPGSSPALRERRVTEAKARYAALLRRFAAGDTDDLTPHELRILHAFGGSRHARRFPGRDPANPLPAGAGRPLPRGAGARRRLGESDRADAGPARRSDGDRRPAARRVVLQSCGLLEGGRGRAVAVHARHGPALHAGRQPGR